MKILKWLGILAALFVLLLVVVAWMIPETRYTTEVTIDRPIDEVWEKLCDEELTTEWIVNLTEFERLSGEPLEVGTTYRLVFDQNGTPFEMNEEVVAIRAKEMLALRLDNPIVTTDMVLRLEDLNGTRTRITTDNGVRGKHVFRFFMPAMKQQMIDEQATSYDEFKVLCEGEPAGAAEWSAEPAPEDPSETSTGTPQGD